MYGEGEIPIDWAGSPYSLYLFAIYAESDISMIFALAEVNPSRELSIVECLN